MGRTASRSYHGGNKKAVIAIIIVAVIAVVAVLGVFVIMPELEKKQYNLEYKDLIEKYSAQYDLDPYFVAAIIHTESGFDPEAVSKVGAIGLMQIMPETGDWIAGKLGKENFTSNDLYDPQTNIEMGCWYLDFLEERFDSLPVMMAAYNAGHNKVKEWLGDPQYSQDGKTLTSIPYDQTDNYVKKVTKAYEKYKEYYELG